MKNKNKELDVDFIGGQKPMTKDEELAISEFIRADKEKRKQRNLKNNTLNTFTNDKQTA